jgi:hypothetical protein
VPLLFLLGFEGLGEGLDFFEFPAIASGFVIANHGDHEALVGINNEL